MFKLYVNINIQVNAKQQIYIKLKLLNLTVIIEYILYLTLNNHYSVFFPAGFMSENFKTFLRTTE